MHAKKWINHLSSQAQLINHLRLHLWGDAGLCSYAVGFLKRWQHKELEGIFNVLPKPPQQQALNHWELSSPGIKTALEVLVLKTQPGLCKTSDSQSNEHNAQEQTALYQISLFLSGTERKSGSCALSSA